MTSPPLLTLWHPSTRYDRALMDATFAPDFHEFGRSGRRHTRAELLDAAPHDITATLHDFTEHPLSGTITLCTHISEISPKSAIPPAPNGPTAPRSGTAPQAAGSCAFTRARPFRRVCLQAHQPRSKPFHPVNGNQ